MIIAYFLSAVVTMGLLQIISGKQYFASRFKRTIAGGTAGTSSYTLLASYTSTESFLLTAVEGTFGIFGYFMLLGLMTLVGVWTWNLFSTRKYLVV